VKVEPEEPPSKCRKEALCVACLGILDGLTHGSQLKHVITQKAQINIRFQNINNMCGCGIDQRLLMQSPMLTTIRPLSLVQFPCRLLYKSGRTR